MRRPILMLIATLAVGVGVWQVVSANNFFAAGIVWALLATTVSGLAIYRIKIGSYPRHFLRSGTLGDNDGKIHQADVIGASLTLLTTIYSILLLILLADALINHTIEKLVRLLSFG